MIKKLQEEVQSLRARLMGGGDIPGQISMVSDHQPETGKQKKNNEMIREENESLKEQLFELQAEYDHYKEMKSKQIEELADKVEKLNEVEEELMRYQGEDDLHEKMQ